MEHIDQKNQMLDLMIRPAFSVINGVIDYVNQAATVMKIPVGTSIGEFLPKDCDAYQNFKGGTLHLQMVLGGYDYSATVTRIGDAHIFLLEEEDSAQLQTLALAAKELREPLSNLLIATDRFLPPMMSGENQQDRQYAQIISQSMNRILRLISNMSDATRYAASSSYRKDLMNFNAVVEEIFEKAASFLDGTGITLRYHGLQQEVNTLIDTEVLERAIYNMISNAIKFSPEGGVIQASLTRHDNWLHLTVEDSGTGIPANLLGSVYSRYLRQPCLEDPRHGVGLGMVVIRSAAIIHGGTVLIVQPEGKGTRITLTFRIQENPGNFRSPSLHLDYAGERDHALMELSDCLPSKFYTTL